MSTEFHAHDGTAWRKAKAISIYNGGWLDVKKMYVHDGTSWQLAFSGADVIATALANNLVEIISVSSTAILFLVRDATNDYSLYTLDDANTVPTLLTTFVGSTLRHSNLTRELYLLYNGSKVVIVNVLTMTVVENVSLSAAYAFSRGHAYISGTLTCVISITSARQFYVGNGVGLITYPTTCIRESDGASISSPTSFTNSLMIYCNGVIYVSFANSLNYYWYNISSGVFRFVNNVAAGQGISFVLNGNVYSRRLGIVTGSTCTANVIGYDIIGVSYPSYPFYTITANDNFLNLSTLTLHSRTDPVSGLAISVDNFTIPYVDGSGNYYFEGDYSGVPFGVSYLYKVSAGTNTISRLTSFDINLPDGSSLLSVTQGDNIQFYIRYGYATQKNRFLDTNTAVLKNISTNSYPLTLVKTNAYTYICDSNLLWRLYNVSYT